jgi:hypothetical protein
MAIAFGFVAFPGVLPAVDTVPQTVEFNRDIRPILSDNCFACHGPDKAQRKADLHFDTEAGAKADLGGHRAIAAGAPDQSEILLRITSRDDDERMPPPETGRRLSPRDVQLIRQWIVEGARWQSHWSFIPPRQPALPVVKDPLWPRGALDTFVLARLDREGLGPSRTAEKATLIRRVTLDLTGLPPTLDEVDAFLADASPDAYERVVDRLLASPRYGERMAIGWLEAARYADTNGYQTDGERLMWRWRDWVIDALNANMPFDQFTIEQLAGDMLLGATLQQRIATGFNRNHRGNAEGGIIPQEYAVEYVADRVETTSTVWLGMTIGCARCHNHKFDPITQRDFYQLFAYFNNVPEKGKAIKFGNSPPLISAPTTRQQRQLDELERRLAAANDRLAKFSPARATAQAEWERAVDRQTASDWTISDGLVAHYDLRGRELPVKENVADFGFFDRFSFAVRVHANGPGNGTILSRMVDDDSRGEGYQVRLVDGKIQVNLVKRWLDDAIRVETQNRVPADRSAHVVVTYDGSRVAAGVQVYLDGRAEPLIVHLDDLNQSFQTKQPLRIGIGGGPASRFDGSIAEVRIFQRALSSDDAQLLATSDSIGEILAVPAPKRTAAQARKLAACFLDRYAPPEIREAHAEAARLRGERTTLVESFPTTMVMEEMPRPRKTHVLIRGQYDRPGAAVEPGVPSALGSLPANVASNRLALARWLVDPTHPLTARVAVNRYWQLLFGAGLVKTVDDFGAQGEWPSHPELLDWLAIEFIRSAGDVKSMHRRIVTSAANRQASHVSPAMLARDPENRLLARGPRLRLSAEMIRDQALAASGLLVERLGGPSVKPYQPAGLWKELAEVDDYPQDHGEKLYRRSLYTFWKRTVAPPTMTTFDAPLRETCWVRVARTNTPLQALVLLNEPTFVEAARVLAERIMKEDTTVNGRLTLGFRLFVARPPRPRELEILRGHFEGQLQRFRENERAAKAFLSVGESKPSERLSPVEMAAYAATVGLIMNLDDTVTKE